MLQPPQMPSVSDLIIRFVNSSPHHLDTIDRNRIGTLYTWSCALPGSLTDDQLALLYACLCRATCMGEFMAGEDGVRLFRMAHDHLERCDTPSMTALCKLWLSLSQAMCVPLIFSGTIDSGRLCGSPWWARRDSLVARTDRQPGPMSGIGQTRDRINVREGGTGGAVHVLASLYGYVSLTRSRC
jgi:hypothetical protein